MTNRSLEVFVAVAECGKMSQAAKELFITQSSVSQAISEIEREYGVLLFERLSRSLYLTDTGRAFLEYAKRALALQSEMESFLRDASGEGRLRIGATVTVGTCLISPITARLEEIAPSLRCEVTVDNTQEIEKMLLKSRLDIALVEGMITHPDLNVTKMVEDELVLICDPSHPFYGLEEIDISRLEGQPFILREEGSGTRAQFENIMRECGITVDKRWESCNSEAIINGVMGGHGVSVISRRLVEDKLNGGRLWACGIKGVKLGRTFDLVCHKDKVITPAIEAFTQVCRQFGEGQHEKA